MKLEDIVEALGKRYNLHLVLYRRKETVGSFKAIKKYIYTITNIDNRSMDITIEKVFNSTENTQEDIDVSIIEELLSEIIDTYES